MAWAEKRGDGYRVRYRLPDGSLFTENGFDTREEAENRARDVESDQRRGRFVDPRLAQTLFGDWVREWVQAHDVSPVTWATYDSHLRNHILPRFADTELGDLSRMVVKIWAKQLRRSLGERSVADVVNLLSRIMGEAVDEGLIGANPCRKLRLATGDQPERPHATAAQIVGLAARVSPDNAALIVTAAYTGLRWGELTGLQWTRVDTANREIRVDGKDGALHEVGGKLTLGPPKTPASVRTVHLPEFLVDLLDDHHDRHPAARFVFTGTDGGFHRRSNFRRRVWLPALHGDTATGRPRINPEMHFHDLRHTHKTWLIEDRVPEVLQHKRIGHKFHGVMGVYSHVTQPMIDAMLAGLQHRWEQTREQTGSTNP